MQPAKKKMQSSYIKRMLNQKLWKTSKGDPETLQKNMGLNKNLLTEKIKSTLDLGRKRITVSNKVKRTLNAGRFKNLKNNHNMDNLRNKMIFTFNNLKRQNRLERLADLL